MQCINEKEKLHSINGKASLRQIFTTYPRKFISLQHQHQHQQISFTTNRELSSEFTCTYSTISIKYSIIISVYSYKQAELVIISILDKKRELLIAHVCEYEYWRSKLTTYPSHGFVQCVCVCAA